MFLQQVRQARQATIGGIAGNAGVDDITVWLLLLEQRHPAVFARYTISRTETVAQHQNRLRGLCIRTVNNYPCIRTSGN